MSKSYKILKILILLLFYTSCINDDKKSLKESIKNDKSYTLIKDSNGCIIKKDVCSICDTLNLNYERTTMFYSECKLVLVEEKYHSHIDVLPICLSVKDSMTNYRSGMYFFNEYLNHSFIAGSGNKLTVFEESLENFGQNKFKHFLDSILFRNYNLHLNEGEFSNFLTYIKLSKEAHKLRESN